MTAGPHGRSTEASALAGTTDHAVGVMLRRDLPARDILPFAVRAEELGFDEVWVVEDLGFRGGVAQAAAVLATTHEIRVGIGIKPAAARNAGFAAMEANTLAEMFPGRVEIGLGHGMPGWMRQVGAWPASPLTMLREHTESMRSIMRGERVTTTGRYVHLDDVVLETPATVVPPVLLGVRGPRSLALAGEVADGTILAEPAAPEYIAAALDQIGDAPGHRLVAYNFARVDPDENRAVAQVRRRLGSVTDPAWAAHLAPLPFAAELAKVCAEHDDADEITARLPAAWVRQLAIVGSPASARERIAQMHRAGAASVVLIPTGDDPLTELPVLAQAI